MILANQAKRNHCSLPSEFVSGLVLLLCLNCVENPVELGCIQDFILDVLPVNLNSKSLISKHSGVRSQDKIILSRDKGILFTLF